MKRSLICLAFLTAGCASVGTDFNVATVQSLQPGMTEAQVIQILGQPNTRTRLMDGSEQLGWVYGHSSAFGSTTGRAAMLKFGADLRYIGVVSTSETQARF
jgi:hypothetical protein